MLYNNALDNSARTYRNQLNDFAPELFWSRMRLTSNFLPMVTPSLTREELGGGNEPLIG